MNTILFLGGAGLVAYGLTRKMPTPAAACADATGKAIECPDVAAARRRKNMTLAAGGGLLLASVLL